MNRITIFLVLLLLWQTGQIAADQRLPYDIPVPENEYADSLIKKYRSEYLTAYGKAWLSNVLDTGELYRLYVRRELQRRGMPESIEYLPVVESEYKPSALSKSGAAGLWQFMTNSITPFLLKNEWIDERFDPWLSTDAALTKLQDNYRMFGDWTIAIAAYNCGAGAMKRILDASPQKSFWYIAEHNLLRDQSVQYVPKLIAISDLARNSTFYDIVLPDIPSNSRFADFDTITVITQFSLSRLASELRIDISILRMLNPALIKECTPPNKLYILRLPEGMKNAARIALSDMNIPSAEQNEFTLHTVKQGETLWFIAKTTGCSLAELCELNKIKKNNVLATGKLLYLPLRTADNK